MNVAPGECVVIEDSQVGITSGLAAGVAVLVGIATIVLREAQHHNIILGRRDVEGRGGRRLRNRTHDDSFPPAGARAQGGNPGQSGQRRMRIVAVER